MIGLWSETFAQRTESPQTVIMKSGSPPVMRGSKQSKGAWRAVTVEAVVAPGPVSAAA